MDTRRILISLPLLAALLACSSVAGLLTGTPRVGYPGASELSLDADDRADAFAELFTSALFGFESHTTFATTEDAGDDVRDYFDESLDKADWEMGTDDWLESGDHRVFSVWIRDERYGAVVMIADDLDSDALDYFEDEIGLDGLERGQTLVVTHTWDATQITTRGSEPPVEWDDESFEDLGITVYLPGEWSANEMDGDGVSLGGWSNAYLYRVDGGDFGDYSFDFSPDASASDLIESFLDEQDFDAVGDIESISTAAGQGSRAFFEVDRGQYGYIGVLPVEDEAIVLVSANVYVDDEDLLRFEAGSLDAIFASIRRDD